MARDAAAELGAGRILEGRIDGREIAILDAEREPIGDVIAHADHRLIGEDGVAAVGERMAADGEAVEFGLRHADADADIGHEGRAGTEIPQRVDHAVEDFDTARRVRARAAERRGVQPRAETAVVDHVDRAHIVTREIEAELDAELAELPAGGAAGDEAVILFRAETEPGRALAFQIIEMRPAALGAKIRTVWTGIGLVRADGLRVAAGGGERRQRDAKSQSTTKLHAIPPTDRGPSGYRVNHD